MKALVQKTLESVRELKPVFGVDRKAAEAPLPNGKTPTDVYAGLLRAGAAIDALGIPTTVPNDVYRVAMTTTSALEKVLKKRGVKIEPPSTERSSGKKPSHAYKQGIELITALKTASDTNAELKVPGGIVVPAMPDDAVTADHVLDLTGNILAEVSALKAALGITQPTALATVQSGKTPSDVYDALSHATQMAMALTQRDTTSPTSEPPPVSAVKPAPTLAPVPAPTQKSNPDQGTAQETSR